MKKVISIMLVLAMLVVFTGCGDNKVIGKTEYGTYGLFNQGDQKNPDVKYRLIIGNVVWSIILVETIVAPIYFLGFSLYEPIGAKHKNEVKGSVD